MKAKESTLRARALAGETLLGCFLTWPTAGIVELLSVANFDFLVVDSEHGPFSIESIASMIIAADAAGLPVIVRVPFCGAPDATRCLDGGADGILLPLAENVAAVRTAVEAIKFAPEGRRGLAGVRANLYSTVPLDQFVSKANASVLSVVQIETSGALADLTPISQQTGVDVLYVGPNDLTQALGIPGQYQAPRYREAVQQVVGAARAARRAAGIMVGRVDQIPGLRELGFTFFTTSDRTLFLESARAWRAALAPG